MAKHNIKTMWLVVDGNRLVDVCLDKPSAEASLSGLTNFFSVGCKLIEVPITAVYTNAQTDQYPYSREWEKDD